MRTLIITRRDIGMIEEHAAKTNPEECCGILLGRLSTEDDNAILIERVVPADNVHPDRGSDRYEIAPETLLRAHKEAQSEGQEVVGYYHSHPSGEGHPSDFDRETAQPDVSYLIVALMEGVVLERKCWRLNKAGTDFLEEGIKYPPEEEYQD
ncbi:MAG: M67 family metallopeptidase [Thermoanaerobaculia bacterium]